MRDEEVGGQPFGSAACGQRDGGKERSVEWGVGGGGVGFQGRNHATVGGVRISSTEPRHTCSFSSSSSCRVVLWFCTANSCPDMRMSSSVNLCQQHWSDSLYT